MIDVHPEERLHRLGLSLPPAPEPLAHYVQAAGTGHLLYLAGHAPLRNGEHQFVDKVGREWSVAQGAAAARLTALNLLATLKATLGDLDRVHRVVTLLGMVNCTEEVTQLATVIDGASDLLVEVFGEQGRHARSVAGMQQLHFGMAIEIEGVVELRQK